MARTPLAGRLEQLTAEVRGEITRRDALKRAGAVTGAALAAGATRWAPLANAATAPRIAVVGGGLAGLTATYHLKQAGYVAQLYEARTDRVGGRCWSDTFPGSNLIYEHGGELIDQGHVDIRQLAQELGLNLVNLLSAEANGTEAFHLFDGTFYSEADATNDLKGIWQQIHSDVSAASYPTLWNSNTQRGRELDAMSIIDWINAYVPGGMSSKLGQLLDVAYNIEYGGESSDQSSLNMLYLLGYSGQGQLRIFGPSNEKYHTVGGNDQIPERLAAALPGQINMGWELTAVVRNTNGTWTLSFANGQAKTVDRVVLAVPFTILRSSVDLKKAQFEPRKMRAINELGMGTNSKMHVGFKTRFWRDLGCNGETYADTGYQNTWEVSRGQGGTAGLLVDYTGGKIGASFGSGTPSSRAKQFLGQIEPLLPGATANWNGNAVIDYWQGYPWSKGSYSYWKVGQYTAFVGIERVEQNGCHFAGEHTSIDFQGYLQGGVETGQRAANEIVAAYKGK
jgi:monoamine oxidase